jgi:hypothetical protein
MVKTPYAILQTYNFMFVTQIDYNCELTGHTYSENDLTIDVVSQLLHFIDSLNNIIALYKKKINNKNICCEPNYSCDNKKKLYDDSV